MTTPPPHDVPAPPPHDVAVHVASVAPGVHLGRAGRRIGTRFLTETVDNNNPIRPLLGDDPDRVSAWVQVTGGDVVLCASESDAHKATPAGSVLPAANTAPWPLRGQGPVWAVQKTAAAATAAVQTIEVMPGNPAPGANFVYTVPAGAPVQLMSAKFTLTTDAVVANRFIFVRIADALGNAIAESADPLAVLASTVITDFDAAGIALNPSGAAGTVLGGLPSLLLQPGWTVTIGGSPLDAGDQVSNIVLVTQPPAAIAAAAAPACVISVTADYAVPS